MIGVIDSAYLEWSDGGHDTVASKASVWRLSFTMSCI